MSAQVSASCVFPVSTMYLEAQLWEQRWWGGEEIGTPDKPTLHNVDQGQANAHDDCRVNAPIWVTGSGYNIESDGNTYYAGTEGNHITDPCNILGG